MNGNLEKYFKKDMEGYYLDKESNEYKLKGVNCSYDRTRNEKAAKQASLESVNCPQTVHHNTSVCSQPYQTWPFHLYKVLCDLFLNV